MATVLITADAQAAFDDLPRPVQPRALAVFVRLEKWPEVSGAKPLRGDLQGNYRIRTGDYRIVFTVDTDRETDEATVTIWKIGYRGDVYD